MKTRLLCCSLLIAIGGNVLLHASPREELSDAVDKLFEAGNYTWELKRLFDLDSSPRSTWGHSPLMEKGETEIFHFTLASLYRREVVVYGNQTAFRLKAGWKLAGDLDDEDIKELGFIGTGKGAREFYHPPVHEILRMILHVGRNYRKEGPAIVGDLASTIHEFLAVTNYVQRGVPFPPPEPPPSGLTALLLPKSRQQGGASAGFAVYIEGGEITEVSIDLKSAADISFNGGPREHHATASSFTTRLSKIGTTKVEIDPEAKALF